MPVSYALIAVFPEKFECKPPCPQVVGGPEAFQIGVDWLGNGRKWRSVTVQNFQDSNGTPIPVSPPQHTWDDGNASYQPFVFPTPAADYYCKYEVVLVPYSGDPFTVDPVVLVKRPGFSESSKLVSV